MKVFSIVSIILGSLVMWMEFTKDLEMIDRTIEMYGDPYGSADFLPFSISVNRTIQWITMAFQSLTFLIALIKKESLWKLSLVVIILTLAYILVPVDVLVVHYRLS